MNFWILPTEGRANPHPAWYGGWSPEQIADLDLLTNTGFNCATNSLLLAMRFRAAGVKFKITMGPCPPEDGYCFCLQCQILVGLAGAKVARHEGRMMVYEEVMRQVSRLARQARREQIGQGSLALDDKGKDRQG